MAALQTLSYTKVCVKARVAVRAPKATVVCKASSSKAEVSTRRGMLSLGLMAAIAATAPKAKADIIEDLLAKTEANKALNDKKRLATSGANFERSRTVTDGVCAFPNNLVGCENLAERGNVKFLSDDLKLECEGVEGPICPAKAKGSLPSFLGV